jgi:hypothetical protein
MKDFVRSSITVTGLRFCSMSFRAPLTPPNAERFYNLCISLVAGTFALDNRCAGCDFVAQKMLVSRTYKR